MHRATLSSLVLASSMACTRCSSRGDGNGGDGSGVSASPASAGPKALIPIPSICVQGDATLVTAIELSISPDITISGSFGVYANLPNFSLANLPRTT